MEKEIATRIESFVKDLQGLVREAALEAVKNALGAKGSSAATSRLPVAAKTTTTTGARKAGASTPTRTPRRRKGGKRTQADLERTMASVHKDIIQHPGHGVESIGKRLGLATADLQLPILKLLASKSIRKEGEKRATRYFAGKGK